MGITYCGKVLLWGQHCALAGQACQQCTRDLLATHRQALKQVRVACARNVSAIYSMQVLRLRIMRTIPLYDRHHLYCASSTDAEPGEQAC